MLPVHAYNTLRDDSIMLTSSLELAELASDLDFGSYRIETYTNYPGMLFVYTSSPYYVYLLRYTEPNDKVFKVNSKERASMEKHVAYITEKFPAAGKAWISKAPIKSPMPFTVGGKIELEQQFHNKLCVTPHARFDTYLQGKGLAVNLYGMILNNGFIFATDGHTQAAAALWDRLGKLPGIELAWAKEDYRTHRLIEVVPYDPENEQELKVLFSRKVYKDYSTVLKALTKK